MFQYTKIINDLTIRNFEDNGSNGLVIPHSYFSSRAFELVKKDEKTGKLKKIEKDGIQEYTKKEGEKVISYTFNDENLLLESKLENSNEVLHNQKLVKMDEIINFDENILFIDTNNVNVTYMK
ncbi:hypothetical protein K0T92_05765 [Paenibacillus oenotherae]|uniref:Uncharacterized protein n=1 Tax=Paenibacillus oenotherae TaxID=1435645 RepID=A0ABS7D2W4_9BACL|nr:hypothetical protein [Paenibacillus oenotherae]MBW7474243.1 hypothetical protein [Paenibacillus oenotherae]